MGILARFFGGSVRAQIENCRSGVSQMLAIFLFERYAKYYDREQAINLAAAVTNALFGLPPTNETGRVYLANYGFAVEDELREIKNEPQICYIVSVFTHMLANVAGNSGTLSAEMVATGIKLRELGILLPIEQIKLPRTPEELKQQAQEFERWIIGKTSPSLSPSVYLLSYTFCYQGFPKILFACPTQVISTLQGFGIVALQRLISSFLKDYVKKMPAAAPHIPENFGSLFSVEVREINAQQRVVLISYPPPPNCPVELQRGQLILAPYFTAVVFNSSDSAKFRCFALGQSPTGGTTLRSISGEDSHANCGVGCTPVLGEFLKLVVQLERQGVAYIL